MDDAEQAWFEREHELLEERLETARVYQFAAPDSNYTDDFLGLTDKLVDRRDFFIKDHRYRNGELELDIETDPDHIQAPDSISDLFCDECDSFRMSLGVIGDKHICSGCWEDGDWGQQNQLTDFAHQGEDDVSTYALVGCGAAKNEGTHPAKDLYSSTYFKKKREFAEELTDEWYILSAKYGVIDPEREIEDYDMTIEDVPVDGWLKRVNAYLENEVDFTEDDEVYVLLGKRYLEAENKDGESLRTILDGYDVDMNYPFDRTSGIGEQNQYLNDSVEAGEPVALD